MVYDLADNPAAETLLCITLVSKTGLLCMYGMCTNQHINRLGHTQLG